jgi:hypothetical protein
MICRHPFSAIVGLAFASFVGLAGCPARASVPAGGQPLTVGMNFVNPGRLTVAQQDQILAEMKAAGVKVIRCGISADETSLDFARRVYAAGIKIEMTVGWVYPKDAPRRPYQPDKFPGMWPEAPLSSADPELSRASFQTLLAALDAKHIVPVAFEMGNEINWTAFNGEFPLPGKGVIFDYEQLSSDPEGRQIARGYTRYVELLKVFKQVRDQSQLNRQTPILTAGLSDPGVARSGPPGGKDAVTINATIQFLRAQGADRYVDGYGIHEYPWEATAQKRKTALENNAVAACGNGAPGQAKPCWITEWGLKNTSEACPLDDQARAAEAREMMESYRELGRQGRLLGAIYYQWGSGSTADPLSVYRCGAETATARVVLTP